MRLLFIALTLSLGFCTQPAQQSSPNGGGYDSYSKENAEFNGTDANKENPDDVYVCMSGTAYAYHRDRDCRGLRSCTHKIETMSEATAKAKYKRKRCGYCYK